MNIRHISHFSHILKKKNKKFLYPGLGILAFLFIFIGAFAVTKNGNPEVSELSFVEHSSLGKDSGSVVPASCESGYVHSDAENPAGDPSVCADRLQFWADSYSVTTGTSVGLHWYLRTSRPDIYPENAFLTRGWYAPGGYWLTGGEAIAVQTCQASGDWVGERYTENVADPVGSQHNLSALGGNGGGNGYWYARLEDTYTGPLSGPVTFYLSCTLTFHDGSHNLITVTTPTKTVHIDVTPPIAPTVQVNFQ
ncbi:MAG: hypothetical protein JWN37_18 [Candidatus Nomurabacteria bacterium]|nr:hypothetical protein [Candidatus Nomurabacteria bacterium]